MKIITLLFMSMLMSACAGVQALNKQDQYCASSVHHCGDCNR